MIGKKTTNAQVYSSASGQLKYTFILAGEGRQEEELNTRKETTD